MNNQWLFSVGPLSFFNHLMFNENKCELINANSIILLMEHIIIPKNLFKVILPEEQLNKFFNLRTMYFEGMKKLKETKTAEERKKIIEGFLLIRNSILPLFGKNVGFFSLLTAFD